MSENQAWTVFTANQGFNISITILLSTQHRMAATAMSQTWAGHCGENACN